MASTEKGRRAKAVKQIQPPSKSTPKAKVKERASIDYPQENDEILPGHYAVRISANDEGLVEISVDGGGWNVCRPASGFYWFDWQAVGSGPHELTVRLRTNNGKTVQSEKRICVVTGSSSN